MRSAGMVMCVSLGKCPENYGFESRQGYSFAGNGVFGVSDPYVTAVFALPGPFSASAELSGRIGMSQSDLSKLERRRDVRVSTLRELADAVGGRLRILLEVGGEQAELESGAS